MATNISGTFQVKPVKYELGNGKKGPEVRIEAVIVGGEHDGRKLPYSGNFSAKGVKYTKRSLANLGWQGKTIATAEKDIMTSPKTIQAEVEVARWENPETGKVSEWSTIRSFGTYTEPLKPLAASDLKDVDSWLAEVPDDAPASNGSNGASRQDDIPF